MNYHVPITQIAKSHGMSPITIMRLVKENGIAFKETGSGQKTFISFPVTELPDIEAAVKLYKESRGPGGRPNNAELDRNACADLRAELLPILKSISDRLDAIGLAVHSKHPEHKPYKDT